MVFSMSNKLPVEICSAQSLTYFETRLSHCRPNSYIDKKLNAVKKQVKTVRNRKIVDSPAISSRDQYSRYITMCLELARCM